MAQVSFLSADWQIFMLTENVDVPIYITPDQMKKKKPARDVNLIIYSLSLFSITAHNVFNSSQGSQGINLLVLDQFPHEESIFCSRRVSHLLFPS